MNDKYGYIEVDLFSSEINDPEHPEVVRFKALLEEVAREYNCSLTYFELDHGTVTFSFDNDELIAEILRILRNGHD